LNNGLVHLLCAPYQGTEDRNQKSDTGRYDLARTVGMFSSVTADRQLPTDYLPLSASSKGGTKEEVNGLEKTLAVGSRQSLEVRRETLFYTSNF